MGKNHNLQYIIRHTIKMPEEKSKAEIIAERVANLPLPEDPPVASDWNSANDKQNFPTVRFLILDWRELLLRAVVSERRVALIWARLEGKARTTWMDYQRMRRRIRRFCELSLHVPEQPHSLRLGFGRKHLA